MSRSLMQSLKETAAGLSRRDLFKSGGLVALPALLLGRQAAAAPAPVAAAEPALALAPGGLEIGPNLYKSIGVRQFINGTGTLTVNSGSLELPEVQAAQEWASKHMVQLDELMEAVGARLATLTGAEFGIVTSGCAAAMTHAAAACLTGGNPEKHVHLPSMEGMDKSEIIIPKAARNNYDAALRATGAKIVEVRTVQELEAAINPKTAMIYLRSEVPNGPPTNVEVYRIAQARNIPTLVDAAPEVLTMPNVHLQAGATMVCYSGGKQLRGPQCTGLLLGRKDLVRAAWVGSAPHHGFSRSMKVGKEEIMGLLAAVEVWSDTNQTVRWQKLIDKCQVIAKKMGSLQGVTTRINETAPTQLSNRNVSVVVSWDPTVRGITGQEVARILDTTEPRILVSGGGGGGGRRGGGAGGAGAAVGAAGAAPAAPQAPTTQISVAAFNLGPNEEKIVAERVHSILSARHTLTPPTPPAPPAATITGVWDVEIQFRAGKSTHTLTVATQEGAQVQGRHKGDFLERPLNGTVNGTNVRLTSNIGENANGNSLNYTFTGTVAGGLMSGALSMGEYLDATWSATRRV
jgi:L-seryl-tRNA(Ser) seleniumtransferase